MDDIFSYWPLLFLIFAIFTRIMKTINEKSSPNIEKSEINNKVESKKETVQNSTEDMEVSGFDYDKDDEGDTEFEPIIDEQTEEYRKKQKDNTEDEKSKKLRVRKLKKKKKIGLFNKKENLIRGIIMKEILDEPKFKE